MLSLSITVNAEPHLVPVVCAALRSLAREAGFPERDVRRIELAVDEACTNALLYACGRDASQQYRVEADVGGDTLEMRFYDRGAGFDFDHAGEAAPCPCSVEEMKVGGLGVLFYKSVMDEASYGPCPSGENCLRLVKRLPQDDDTPAT